MSDPSTVFYYSQSTDKTYYLGDLSDLGEDELEMLIEESDNNLLKLEARIEDASSQPRVDEMGPNYIGMRVKHKFVKKFHMVLKLEKMRRKNSQKKQESQQTKYENKRRAFFYDLLVQEIGSDKVEELTRLATTQAKDAFPKLFSPKIDSNSSALTRQQ